MGVYGPLLTQKKIGQEGCGFLTPRGKRERGAGIKVKREKVLKMKAFRFAFEFDSSMELEHVTEQELSGERGDVLEAVLVKHVEEHEPLLDGDEDVLGEASQHVKAHESLSDIDEHVLVDQRTGPSSTKSKLSKDKKIVSINRATMVGSSIQPDSNATDEKKR